MDATEAITTERPLLTFTKKSARALGLLLKAIIICFGFCAIGGGLAPFIFIGMMLGMFPNILKAVFSWVVTVPLLGLLPFHATYALVMVLGGRSPDYTKGVYGAVDWVESNKLYDPT